jgi:hypothetical protein
MVSLLVCNANLHYRQHHFLSKYLYHYSYRLLTYSWYRTMWSVSASLLQWMTPAGSLLVTGCLMAVFTWGRCWSCFFVTHVTWGYKMWQKAKFVPVHAVKACRWGRRIAPFWLWHKIGVSVQIHALAAFHTGKEPPLPIGKGTGFAPLPGCKFYRI